MRWSLLIGDSEKTVVFSSHALEQIEERAVIDSKRYVEKGFFFAIPYSYRRFELVKLPSGQDAIQIWNWCDPNMFLGKLFFELIGPGNAKMHRTSDGRILFIRDQEAFFYLVGYCPLDVHDKDANYVVCKTLLLPGMDNTPEHLAFLRSKKRDTIERAEFGKRVGKSTFKHLFQSKDFNVFRELHGYVPQVKPIPGEVFHYPGMKPV
jgi:hypothetical protein